ncbi:MAG: nucleoside triphosphate pyrophosphohydrolase [Negativicutes bacterium]|nr:nucleoside triphosphate pyrophosphohydrolase [Negativicutes bacterium]
MNELIIVGLGPGSPGHLTAETLDILAQAKELLLRTDKHPTAEFLRQKGIQFTSYDYMYERHNAFADVYSSIAADCLRRAAAGPGVVFAVPGSPLVAEKTVALLREQAAAAGVAVRIIPGMSFLEVLYARLGIDPVDGLMVVDAADIPQLPVDLAAALVVTQVYNRQVASDAKLALMELYPDHYPVTVVKSLGLPGEEVRQVPLYEMDRVPDIDHLTSIYLPGRKSRLQTFALTPLVDIMARLRAPEGCLWDIEQTHASLRRYIVEEVYEVLEAIELAAPEKLCEELGDLLLQIVFHARIAEEAGEFSMQDVIDTVCDKMIRRHPHVFGDISVSDAAEVVVNWDKIKNREKGGAPGSALDGVPGGLPSLMRAFKLQAKAAKVGFDWDNIEPVWAKIREELDELRQAIADGAPSKIEDELGDVLFAVVNLSRFIDTEPETALNRTNNKFVRRFRYIEEAVRRQGKTWKEYTLSDLDRLWEDAKRQETKKFE